MRAWVLVAAVLWYFPRTGWQRFSEVTKKGFIYGKPTHTVKVYVELHHNSPFLVCMDIKHAKKETVDPTYSWIGPNEKPLKGNYRVNITQTGKLMVKDFPETLSGLYTCTFSYKIIKARTRTEKTVKQTYEFMMFAYREPDYSYQMAVRYTTKSCVGSYNDMFLRVLKRVLDNLISDLSCRVIESSYKCHFVKLPKHGLVYELFIAFQVNPFAPQWKSACQNAADCEEITNHNILQARDRIAEFFRRQAYVFYHNPDKILPAMHFVDHSFEMWFVVLGLSVLMLMLPVRPALPPMPMEPNCARKLKEQREDRRETGPFFSGIVFRLNLTEASVSLVTFQLSQVVLDDGVCENLTERWHCS